MTEGIALALLWAGFLGYIAVASKEAMQLTWIILVGLILASPVIAYIWPAFR